MDSGVQHAYHDLSKSTEEDCGPSVRGTELTELTHCIYQSVEYGDLVMVSGEINMLVGSGKKVSVRSVLSDLVQC